MIKLSNHVALQHEKLLNNYMSIDYKSEIQKMLGRATRNGYKN